MALITRLAGRPIYSKFLKSDHGIVSLIRPVTLQASKVQEPPKEGHDERNMRLGRPQSPHLTIYRPQVTSMLSISHRMTGMALAGYAMTLGLGAIAFSPECIVNSIEALECMKIGAPALFLGKMTVAFPLSYHFWNGIRHLLWDTGKFLTIKEVYLTGYIMLAVATVSAIGLSAM